MLSAPATAPRRLGFSDITVLHAGDRLLATPGAESWLEAPDALKKLPTGLPGGLDAGFSKLRGKLPPRSKALSTLTAQSKGALEALGTFDYQDNRPADGAESLKVLLRASKPGTFTLLLRQSFERESRRTPTPERGVLEQRLTLVIVPAGTAVDAMFGELEPADSTITPTITLGAGDLFALPISLGFSNRSGSETRGAPGLSVTAR